MDTIDIRNLVFIDETGVNLAMTRSHGRNFEGERAHDECPGKNVTIIGAMSDEGLIGTMSLTGGVNTDSFLVYVEKILLPVLWIGAIVVMDNLPVHHADKIKSLIESVGEDSKISPSLFL